MTRLAVFDCDGTLVDGQAAICEAMDAGFAAVSLPLPDRHQVRRMVGLSLPQAIARLVPEAEPQVHRQIVDAYKPAFAAARRKGLLYEPLYDGIADLLDQLRNQGWQLAVATGKSDRGLAAVLDTHGLTGHFVSLQTADRHPSKPHPAMLEAALFDSGIPADAAVMIGDTGYDMAMARSAGVKAIGVEWGYHTREELLAEGAEAIAATPGQLGSLIG